MVRAEVVLQSTEEQVSSKAEQWLQEAEKARDWFTLGLVLVRFEPKDQSGSTRLNKSCNFLVDALANNRDRQVYSTLEYVLTRAPGKLHRAHGRLVEILKQRLGLDAGAARCFALLAGAGASSTHLQNYRDAFDSLVDAVDFALEKKDIEALKSSVSGLSTFLEGRPRREGVPSELRIGLLLRLVERCACLNASGAELALELLTLIAVRSSTAGSPWLTEACHCIEMLFEASEEHPELRSNLYRCTAAMLRSWGLAVARRLSTPIITAVEHDWSSELPSLYSFEVYYAFLATGISLLTTGKSRTQLDILAMNILQKCIQRKSHLKEDDIVIVIRGAELLVRFDQSNESLYRATVNVFRAILSSNRFGSHVHETARVSLNNISQSLKSTDFISAAANVNSGNNSTGFIVLTSDSVERDEESEASDNKVDDEDVGPTTSKDVDKGDDKNGVIGEEVKRQRIAQEDDPENIDGSDSDSDIPSIV